MSMAASSAESRQRNVCIILRAAFFNGNHLCSMGLRSGEYGDMNGNRQPAASIHRLNMSASVWHSKIHGAASFPLCRQEMTLRRFFAIPGFLAWQRSPLGLRPYA